MLLHPSTPGLQIGGDWLAGFSPHCSKIGSDSLALIPIIYFNLKVTNLGEFAFATSSLFESPNLFGTPDPFVVFSTGVPLQVFISAVYDSHHKLIQPIFDLLT